MEPRSRSQRVVLVGIAAVGLLAIGMASTPQDTAQPTKPVVTQGISTEFIAPPQTVREMAIEADAVVRGRVVGSRPHDDPKLGAVRTLYSFRISELLQNLNGPVVTPEKTIEVLRMGGVRPREKTLLSIVETDFPQFKPGTEYVLFLHWNPDLQVWIVLWGPAGVVELANGRAHAWSDRKPISAMEGRAANEVLNVIRTLHEEDAR